MTCFGRWTGVAVVALGLAGCDSGSSETAPVTVTPGGPGSFEEDQKKQADMMRKAAANPGALPKK